MSGAKNEVRTHKMSLRGRPAALSPVATVLEPMVNLPTVSSDEEEPVVTLPQRRPTPEVAFESPPPTKY